ncbi:MAG: IS66 family insertion sequence element accessory protein TnpA [Bacteroidia bacterium]
MFKLIEQWQQSKLTQNVFCQQQSIKYHVFHYWYKRYREQHESPQSNAASFVKLQIAKPASPDSVEIYFPDGIRLVFHEPVSSNYLKALIS